MTEEHVTPKITYVIIGVVLLGLTLATYLAALVNLGPWNTVVALAIAIVKGVLIALFFMQLRFSGGMTRVVLGAGILWLGILIIGILDDFASRGLLGVPGK